MFNIKINCNHPEVGLLNEIPKLGHQIYKGVLRSSHSTKKEMNYDHGRMYMIFHVFILHLMDLAHYFGSFINHSKKFQNLKRKD